MSEVLLEMEGAELLNPTGRNLLAVTAQNPQQRWRDFLKVLVNSSKGNRAHEKASNVINGFNRAKMALALSYAMSTPLGLKIATKAQEHLSTAGPTARTVTNVFQSAMIGIEEMAELATILLKWNRSTTTALIPELAQESQDGKERRGHAEYPPIEYRHR